MVPHDATWGGSGGCSGPGGEEAAGDPAAGAAAREAGAVAAGVAAAAAGAVASDYVIARDPIPHSREMQ